MKANPNRIFSMIVVLSMLMSMTLPALAYDQAKSTFLSDRGAESSQTPQGLTFDVSEPAIPKISQALRDLPQVSDRAETRGDLNPLRGTPEMRGADTKILDPLAANSLNDGQTPDPLFTFEGIGDLDMYTPPDTTGDVGPNHYIQMVNVKMAVYDKTGGLMYGPVDINTLWDGFGGPCENDNDGDPIVLYDDMADRWMISQFALSVLHQCVAVSVGPDPLGEYYLYDFSMPDFPDYPKFGVWPDGYYIGTNTGYPNQYYAHALNREAMLNGNPATRQSFGGIANFLMPADVDGTVLPPEGAPQYFYTYYAQGYSNHPPGVDRLAIYEFDVDWDTPGNSSFTLVTEIPIADFNYTVCGFFVQNCIPEPSPGVLLDSLSYWPMVRLQYRNFNQYESMVGNFTVDLDGNDKAAIRWFELRKIGEDPWSLTQEGTYAPDSSHRWMGSIAQDGSGNIALGYSVSDSTTTKPSIRYAVHEVDDPLGTMQAEASIIEGTGVNTGPYPRWGDYSAMNVDPVDQCTFWYTNEYHDVNEDSFAWNTRVGVFRVPTCTGNLGPTGTLDGTVADSATSDPIVGAHITATLSITQTYDTFTDLSGFYQVEIPIGSYEVTASAFGYLQQTVSGVEVFTDTITTQDFELVLAPTAKVYGTITDANTGWPLYARLDVAGVPGGTYWNDPVTGYYEVSLPVGDAYDFSVNAWIPGYLGGTQTVGPLTGDTQADFALDADMVACTAPGYLLSPFKENFETGDGSFTVSGTTTSWEWGAPASGPGSAHSGGNVWATNLDGDYSKNENGYIESPEIDLSALSGQPLYISWWQYLQSEAVYDKAEVHVSNNGGASWTTVYGPASGPVNLVWAKHTAALDNSYAVSNFRARFRFTSDGSVNRPGWYLDDISAGACSPPEDGGLVAGHVYDANTSEALIGAELSNEDGYKATTTATPLDPALDDGFYTIFSSSGSKTHTASMAGGYADEAADVSVANNETVGQDFFLEAGWLTFAPDSLEASVGLDGQLVQTLTLNNEGGAALSFQLTEVGGGLVQPGTIEAPDQGVVRPRRQENKTTELFGIPRPLPPVDPFNAGQVVKSWLVDEKGSPWGIAYDGLNDTVWVGDGWGSNQTYEYSADGTPTGRSYPHPWNPASGPADTAFNWNTGMLWALDVGVDNCIHEIDPASGLTGETICPEFKISQRGLAYDPSTDTYFAGGWNDGMVYRFDASGTILEAFNTALDIAGLAYNPDSKHLFAMVNSAPNPVYVLDVSNEYAIIGKFSVSEGFGDYAGAGLELDCSGNLWAVDQKTFTVYQFESGETTSVCEMQASWLSVEPESGTIEANSTAEVKVTFDASAVAGYGDYFAQLMVGEDTPYAVSNVPVTMTVVEPVLGVDVGGDQAKNGRAGREITYSVRVTNSGNGPTDSYTLTLGTSTFPASLGQTVVGPLLGHEYVDVPVTVAIPAGAVIGDSDTVEVTATSQADPDLSDTASLTTTVIGGLTFEPAADAASGAAGETVIYTLELTNTGGEATVQLSYSGNTWEVHLPVTSVEVGEGQTVEVVIHVIIPEDAAGGDQDTVTVTAVGLAGDTASSVLTTTVEAGKIFLPLAMDNSTQ